MKQVHASDLNLLRVFIAVAEEQGISAAQNRLNVAPSTISTQILNLEKRIGIVLCDRGRGGFKLTDEGRIVLESAYRLQKNLDDFTGTIGTLKGEAVGKIRIGVIDNIVFEPELKLARAIAELREHYPNISFELSQLPPDAMEAAILSHDIDLGITFALNQIPSLSRHLLYEEKQVIVCGRNHPLHAEDDEDISEAALGGFDWVTRNYPMRRAFPFSSPYSSSASAKSMETVAHLVLSGAYLGYLPEHYAQFWTETGKLRIIHPDQFSYQVPHHLVARNDSLHKTVLSICHKEILGAHGINVTEQ